MIGRLSGKLAGKHPPQVLVDCNGVGYELDVPMSTFYNLPGVGDAVTLHTHLVVREDAQTLYGFGTLEERSAFRQLLKISGIGARTALAVLSGMSVAERLLLELKGKLADVRPSAAGATDVLDALLGLGYSEKEALAALKGLPPGIPVAEGIRAALKALAKS